MVDSVDTDARLAGVFLTPTRARTQAASVARALAAPGLPRALLPQHGRVRAMCFTFKPTLA